jgi:alpha-L-rhamnosidase
VNASVETVAGKVVSNWKKETGSFTHEVVVPANTKATVVLRVSDFEDAKVFEGNEKIWENNAYVEGVPGIHEITRENDRLVVKTGSGKFGSG